MKIESKANLLLNKLNNYYENLKLVSVHDFDLILDSLINDESEQGKINNTERLLEVLLENKYNIIDIVYTLRIIFGGYNDSTIRTNILHIISHYDYPGNCENNILSKIFCIIIYESILSDENDIYLKDFAVKCIENWGSTDFIPLLENCETGIKWFDEYVHDVFIELLKKGQIKKSRERNFNLNDG